MTPGLRESGTVASHTILDLIKKAVIAVMVTSAFAWSRNATDLRESGRKRSGDEH